MSASSLTQRSGALGGNPPAEHWRQKLYVKLYALVQARQAFAQTSFWNVSRLKREGLADPQFKLLSVSSSHESQTL